MEAPPEKKARVYYGSLEEQERARLESGDVTGSTLSVAVQEGIQAGNINITPGALTSRVGTCTCHLFTAQYSLASALALYTETCTLVL